MGMNNWNGIGRLCQDPEEKQASTRVATFTLAIDRDQKEKVTDFIPIVCFGKTAEFATNYLEKGVMIGISGKMQSNQWENKEGKKQTSYNIVADHIYFCERKQTKNDELIDIIDEVPF